MCENMNTKAVTGQHGREHVCVFLFADLPEISVSHSTVLVMEGDNVTVSCNGSGSPLPEVDWTVSGLHSINTHLVRHTHKCTR